MNGRLARPGFSLIEALVVLAISGMALAIIFSIGTKAGDSGFALGRKAMVAADQDIAVGDFRSLVRSVLVRPQATFNSQVDRPSIGGPDRFEGDAVMERATQCAPVGWAGRLVLSVRPRGAERVLVCEAGSQAVELLITRDPRAALSYSRDGRNWSPNVTIGPVSSGPLPPLRSESLYIRFDGGPRLDLIEMASSSRPETWLRPEDAL